MKPKSAQAHLSRRAFLRGTTLSITAFTLAPRHVLGGPNFVAPSEKINIALVGCGGQGRVNAEQLFNHDDARITAVCDPMESADYSNFYFGGVAGRRPVKAQIENHYSAKTTGFKCAEYEDFRAMLEKEKSVDAILCATPDHLHAYVSILAMRQGKHIYCEKPLAHSVWEARRMAKVAKETGVATQMGNQGHSGDDIRKTCEWIWAGAIGVIREVHAWTGPGNWVNHTGRPKETPPVPAGLNWDLWLGPREFRPYHPEYAPYNWRGWWAFGTSAIGDMACHNMDPAVWALDLQDPISVEAYGTGVDGETVSPGIICYYEFAARGNQPPVKLTWYDGGLRPQRPATLPDDEELGAGEDGILFVGDKGMITCPSHGGHPRFIPLERAENYQSPPKKLPRSKGHHRDWLDACKGGPPAGANFEYGARITEIVLLGNVALRTGKKLHWDAANMKATNASEADQFLKGTYRKGWEIG